MVSIIFWTILLYLLYRFIFGFLLPVINAGRQMRMKVRQMQEQMNNQGGYNSNATTSNSNQNSSTQSKATPTPSKEDYIEFEEVK